MTYVNKLRVEFRCRVGRQVAHGSAVTVFLQSCESDSQWMVNFFMQVKPAALSSLRVAWIFLTDPTAAAATLTLQAKPGSIRYTDSFLLFSESDVYLSQRSRTVTAKPQSDLHAAEILLTCTQTQAAGKKSLWVAAQDDRTHKPGLGNMDQNSLIMTTTRPLFSSLQPQKT